jgi:hypothetical protein
LDSYQRNCCEYITRNYKCIILDQIFFMIKRIWHGWTTRQNADAYESLLRHEIFLNIGNRNIKGFRGIDLLRRETGTEVEFITIMSFDELNAVKDFAGENYETAVVPAEAAILLSRYDRTSQHYELLHSEIS